jgi:SNF2 family DNA or RNA helicase
MPSQWDIIDNTASIWVGEVSDPKFVGQKRIKVKIGFERKEIIKSLPGSKWDGIDKVWHLPATPRSMNNVAMAVVAAGIRPEFGLDTEQLVQEARDLEKVNATKSLVDLPDIPGKTPAWLHQRQAFWFAKDFDGVALFMTMGSGKSKVVVALTEAWECRTVLIGCPVSVMGVWPKQYALHGIGEYETYVADGKMTVSKKCQQIAKFLIKRTNKTKIVIANYDIMWRPELLGLLRNAGGWDLIVNDESHKIKSPGGKASKAMYTLSKHSRKVIIQTGTPMPHGPEDIYAQYRACDVEVFGTNFTSFRNKFFKMGGFENRIIQGFADEEKEAEFARRLGSISYSVTKEEMVANLKAAGMEIPGRSPDMVLTAKMDPKSDRIYQSLKNDLVAFLDGDPQGVKLATSWSTLEEEIETNGEYDESKIVVVENALTKMLRLRQITSGCVTTDDGVVQTIGTEKRKLLEDALDGISPDDPVIVFAAFHHDLDVIGEVAAGLGRSYGELSGRRRDALASDSTLADGIQVAGVQLQSGGVGIDFTKSHYNIYYSIDYNLGNYLQSGDRSDRPGQQFPVQQIHLVVETGAGRPTVDGITYEALTQRMSLIEAVIAKSKEL